MNSKEIISKNVTGQLLYTTIRIVGVSNEFSTSFGTGFFFDITMDGSERLELILTNKHVVENCKSLLFYFHEAVMVDDKFEPTGNSFIFELENFSDYCIPHPDENVDLGGLLFLPIAEKIKSIKDKFIFKVSLSDQYIKNDVELLEMTSVVEEVLMVGYPIGLHDEYHNFPIVRKGITASHPALDFNGENIGVVDIACFPAHQVLQF